MATKIDLEQLIIEIRNLQPRQKLFIVLRRELNRIGYWKNKSRGKYAASSKRKYKRYY